MLTLLGVLEITGCKGELESNNNLLESGRFQLLTLTSVV
jgi:hypothetical protein